MKSTGVFIHGLESTSQGTKGVFFRDRYPGMIIEDYSGSFSARMEKLEGLLAGKDHLILVGSSFGGLMAVVYACLHEERVKKLILLAPALNSELSQPCLGKKLTMPVVLFHGRQDDVVPLAPVRAIAEKLFTDLQFKAVEDDHFLHDTFPTLEWDTLLSLQDLPALRQVTP
jgi:pimeloyl-ACP methyl ester carboxylesterase